MPTVNLLLRSAGRGDETRLWDFYRSTLTETLPVPSVGTIRGSLQRGTLLIAEEVGSGNIVATAGYFEYIKSVDGHLVFELAGTRVTTGKLLPFSLQQILLAVRLFQIAATEDQSARPVSIISSARHKRSKENLVCAGMSEIAAMPLGWTTTHIVGRSRATMRSGHTILPIAGALSARSSSCSRLDSRRGRIDANAFVGKATGLTNVSMST